MTSKPTKTINRLHFNDLEPLRFEDLCLSLVLRIGNWEELNHFGRKGNDSGVDIHAIKMKGNKQEIWAIQCKRYSSITKNDLAKIIDKITTNLSIPDKLLLIISCDLSKNHFEFFKQYSFEKGILSVEVWTASVLEARLYNDFKDLLFVYFGIRIEDKEKENISKIKHSLRMEKRILKELINHKFLKENRDFKRLAYEPFIKFISDTVYIRSINDKTYPIIDKNNTQKPSPWFRTFFYDTYYNGLEFWLDPSIGSSVIMDKEGNWEILQNYYDKRKKNPLYKVIPTKAIGRIPYSSIIDFRKDGDEYTHEPHLFCKFENNGSPFEEIYYKNHGDYQKLIGDWDLDKNKQVTFSKE